MRKTYPYLQNVYSPDLNVESAKRRLGQESIHFEDKDKSFSLYLLIRNFV